MQVYWYLSAGQHRIALDKKYQRTKLQHKTCLSIPPIEQGISSAHVTCIYTWVRMQIGAGLEQTVRINKQELTIRAQGCRRKPQVTSCEKCLADESVRSP